MCAPRARWPQLVLRPRTGFFVLDVVVYFSTAGAVILMIAGVLAIPYRAGATLQRARTHYFTERLAAAQARDEWGRYNAERSPMRLGRAHPRPAAARRETRQPG